MFLKSKGIEVIKAFRDEIYYAVKFTTKQHVRLNKMSDISLRNFKSHRILK